MRILSRRNAVLAAIAVLLSLVLPFKAGAQGHSVRGVVLDEADLPMPGAFVTVKGETRGVMTDTDGRFEISVKPTDVLIVSFLGYEDKEIKLSAQTVDVTVKLNPLENQLEEVSSAPSPPSTPTSSRLR